MDVVLHQRLAGADLRTSESFDCEEAFGHGPFQTRMLVLILLELFSAVSQTLVMSLVTGDVDHWCKPLAGFNISAADWKNIAIPIKAEGCFSRCRIYERCKPPADHGDSAEHRKSGVVQTAADEWYNRCFQDTSDPRHVPCEELDYDVRTAEASAVSSWNMVCHQRLLPATFLDLDNAGAVVSLILAGAFVDYLGRRTTLLDSAAAVVTFAAKDCVRYAVVCLLTGASVAVQTIFTSLRQFEVMTHAHRLQHVLLLVVLGLTLCEIWIVIVDAVVTDWRLKQVIFLAPTAVLLPPLSAARESSRWLVDNGRLDVTKTVLMQAAKTNNFPPPITVCPAEKLKKQIRNHGGCVAAYAFPHGLSTYAFT
ncbi:solute carrier family 22 member 7-like [Dermacentor andersoni]|uniref:solute carrier family 22 member 7-like n=1 Tax=Dermacentor andersoni TaxID=34620 RepID=UPI002417D933|nr:solute carrier family 22 member 7-like [Dermacentor andersoni]